MAKRDEEKPEGTTRAAGAAGVTRPRYEPPRIMRKRAVVDVTLQTFSGGCTPGQPGCGIGGN